MKKFTALLAIVSILFGCGGGQSNVGQNVENRAPMLLAQVTIAAGVATFSGPRQNYTITKNGTIVIVTDNVGADGTQTISGVASLKFSDVSVNLAIVDFATKIPKESLSALMELYVAFFNRVPDADGLNYWISQFISGQSLNSIADSFYNAGVANSATTGYSPTMSNSDFVNLVYKNVLGRPSGADTVGLAYWSGLLANGQATHGSLVTSILSSAHTFKGDTIFGWVADLLDNKIAVAKSFAVDNGLTYNSNVDSITKGMAIAALVTPSNTSNALALFKFVSDTSGATKNADTSGPVVSAISVFPTTVDVSISSQTVTATIIVSDATAVNLTQLPAPYWYNTADIQGTRINSTWIVASGNAQNATLTSTIMIPKGAKPGQWAVGCTGFYDTLGFSSTNGGYEKLFAVKN